MSSTQIRCEKCDKLFDGFKQLKLHIAASCDKENEKYSTGGDLIENDTHKEFEHIEKVGEKDEENSTEANKMDYSENEQEIRNTLADLNDFLKEKDSIFSNLDGEFLKSKEAINNADSSIESISTVNIDETAPIEHPPIESFRTAQAPSVLRKVVRRGPAAVGKVPFQAKQCIYCGQHNTDKIRLARHMIAEHWVEVREAQGGGRLDNRNYYANGIEDSRVIKPKLTRTVNRPVIKQVPSLSVAPNWLNKLESNKKITNYSRKGQNSFLKGKAPNRKLPPPASYCDLTTEQKEAEDTCEVCEDEFNWPDEEHRKVCVNNRSKLGTSTAPANNKHNVPLMVGKVKSKDVEKTKPKTLSVKGSSMKNDSEVRTIIKKLSKSKNLQILQFRKT